jgi:signal transduction histidine kinase
MKNASLPELQKDAFVTIVAVIAILALTLLFILLAMQPGNLFDPLTFQWTPSTLALLTCFLSYTLHKADRFRLSVYVFIGGLVLSIISFMLWPNAQFSQGAVYWLVLVMGLAGLLMSPRAIGLTAGLAIVTTLAVGSILNGFSWTTIQPLLVPLAMTGGMAAIGWLGSTYLTTIRKQVGESEAAAPPSSPELLESQRELQKVHSALKITTLRLKEAETAAAEAHELKQRFITNLSHELRTPLTAIINFSYILSQTNEGDITEAQKREYLASIYEAGELLRDIANDLLDLAKIEAGQMELFREPLDLAKISAGVMNTVAGLIKDKPVELHQMLPPDLPPINADKVRIRQILLNLLSNAAKYTNEGHITLQVSRNDGNLLKISVIDTGIGIREKDFERIFEEFQQTEEAFALRKPGAGLGLPISKKFVELHGGQLWVESELGRGSTFHFTLPLEPSPLPPTENGEGFDAITENEATNS